VKVMGKKGFLCGKARIWRGCVLVIVVAIATIGLGL
jgi:hypothetical protein